MNVKNHAMQYEIVTLPKKTVVGLCARTSNQAPDMSDKIGGLWRSLFEEGVYAAIPNKSTQTTLGLYSDYAGDEKDAYDVTVGCEVALAEQLPQGAICKTIPAGNYAKFIIHGDPVNAVMQFWMKLWELPLDRAFTADFEEYLPNDKDDGTCEIHIYISLK